MSNPINKLKRQVSQLLIRIDKRLKESQFRINILRLAQLK